MIGEDFADLEQGRTPIASQRCRPAPERQAFVLQVIEGRDAGISLTIDAAAPAPLLVGQGPACDLRLRDPEVSRRHISLEIVGNRLRVLDLDSTNGTVAGDVAIEAAHLKGGETVRIGSTIIRVERAPCSHPRDLGQRTRFGRVLGESRAMRRLYPLLDRLAASNVPIVIEGETGTGKEVVAESIHDCSPRASGPFVVFDCTAVPPNLVESELFGHERGAFTGAVASRKGVFEQAHGGTLLIDEIGDLELSLQPKLLRAIERSEIRRVGSERVLRVDVRLLAATRRNLDQEVQDGRFRDDLFYRFAVGRVELPPLRRREGDVGVLARHFWKELGADPSALDDGIVRRWESAPWPGNIRELRNAVARQIALGDLAINDAAVDESDVPSSRAASPAPEPRPRRDVISDVIAEGLALPLARMRVVKEFEQAYIASVLEQHGGNVARAAAASGIARRYFQIVRGGTRR